MKLPVKPNADLHHHMSLYAGESDSPRLKKNSYGYALAKRFWRIHGSEPNWLCDWLNIKLHPPTMGFDLSPRTGAY